MPHVCNTNVFILDGDNRIGLAYECWVNHRGEGIVAVIGHTTDDHRYLVNNRKDVADMIKHQEDLKYMRYCEFDLDGSHTELTITLDKKGRVLQALNANASLSTEQLSRQGKALLDEEHAHSMDLSSHGFGKEANTHKPEPDTDHER